MFTYIGFSFFINLFLCLFLISSFLFSLFVFCFCYFDYYRIFLFVGEFDVYFYEMLHNALKRFVSDTLNKLSNILPSFDRYTFFKLFANSVSLSPKISSRCPFLVSLKLAKRLPPLELFS